mgnify:CR=1 FL=1
MSRRNGKIIIIIITITSFLYIASFKKIIFELWLKEEEKEKQRERMIIKESFTL